MAHYILVILLSVLLLRGGTYGDEKFYFGIFRNGGDAMSTRLTLLMTLQDNTTSSNITIETTQGIINSLTLTPSHNSSTEITLPDSLIVTNGLDRLKGICVNSTNKVSITVLSQNSNSSDAYQIYPTTPNSNGYTLTYYAITPGASEGGYYSQVLLVGTDDNSTITISPTHDINISSNLQDLSSNNSIVVLPAGGTYTGILHRLQTLSFESINDLTGSRITSSKPLVVISGHECAQFDSNSTCSFIAEQIPPVYAWGTSFVASPFSFNTSQCYIIMSSVNKTNITQTCTNGSSALISLSESQSHQLTLTNSSSSNQTVFCSLESSSSILVATVYLGEHPLMALVPPVEQYRPNISLSAFSCSLSSTQSLLLFNGTSNAVGSAINNSDFATSVPPYGSVLYLSFEDNFNYHNQEDIGAVVYNLAGCQFAYTMGWNLTQELPTNLPSVITTYSFVTTKYQVLESRGMVEIIVIKTNNFDQQTSVVVTTTSLTNDSSSYSSDDFALLNELIMFDVGETRATLSINITDDELVEPQESYIITLKSNEMTVSGEVVLTIIDDDRLIVGLNRIVYETDTQLLSFEVGVNLGVLAPSINFGLIIKLQPQEWILLEAVKFTHETIAHIIKVNLSRINICNNQSASVCIITTEISLETIGTLNITLNPQKLNGTLSSFSQVHQQTCEYIVGEFTQQSLLISACVTGILLVLTTLSIIIGITGFGLSYHTRRKWTLGGGLNRLYFQDDAMSLATNDPESYELMNRLGEKQTAVLAINDDNEY